MTDKVVKKVYAINFKGRKFTQLLCSECLDIQTDDLTIFDGRVAEEGLHCSMCKYEYPRVTVEEHDGVTIERVEEVVKL